MLDASSAFALIQQHLLALNRFRQVFILQLIRCDDIYRTTRHFLDALGKMHQVMKIEAV